MVCGVKGKKIQPLVLKKNKVPNSGKIYHLPSNIKYCFISCTSFKCDRTRVKRNQGETMPLVLEVHSVKLKRGGLSKEQKCQRVFIANPSYGLVAPGFFRCELSVAFRSPFIWVQASVLCRGFILGYNPRRLRGMYPSVSPIRAHHHSTSSSSSLRTMVMQSPSRNASSSGFSGE